MVVNTMEVVTIYKTDYKELKGLTLCNVNPFFMSLKQILQNYQCIIDIYMLIIHHRNHSKQNS